MGKKIYIVTGSADGLLGAFGSKKKAIKAAEVYVGELYSGWTPTGDNTIYGDWASATVEETELNCNPLLTYRAKEPTSDPTLSPTDLFFEDNGSEFRKDYLNTFEKETN